MATPEPDDLALLYRRGALSAPLGAPASVELCWIARHGDTITTRYPPVDLGTCYAEEVHPDPDRFADPAGAGRAFAALVDGYRDEGGWEEADPAAYVPGRPDTLRPIRPVSHPAGNQPL
jgi:hypothetical protein